MSFSLTYREVRELTLESVLESELAKGIARKAGIRLGSAAAADIWGTFSQVNDGVFGFVSDYLGDAYYFPDDTERMSILSDMSGASQSRLLVTVTQAGAEGSSMGIASDQIVFADSIQLPLDALGVHVSPWVSMTISTSQVYARWVVGNPTLAEGSFGVGLMQWQVR